MSDQPTAADLRALAARITAIDTSMSAGPWEADLDVFDPDTLEIEVAAFPSNCTVLFNAQTGERTKGPDDPAWKRAEASQAMRDARGLAALRNAAAEIVRCLEAGAQALDAHATLPACPLSSTPRP